MALFIDEKELISHSFAILMTQAESTGELFYQRLFEIAPEVKPMFTKTNMENQWKMFIYMLGLGARTVTHGRKDIVTLETLGRRHVKYGARLEHYPIFCQAFLWALEQKLGDQFTPEMALTWEKVLGRLTHEMTCDFYTNTESSLAESV